MKKIPRIPLARMFGLPRARQKNDARLSELLDLWLKTNEIHQKKATVYKYCSMIETHILPELGDTPLRDLTAPMLNSFLNRKLENGRSDGTGGLSSSYVRTIAIIIDSALKLGVQEGLCSPVPSKINKPPVKRGSVSILAPADQRKLEDELQKDPSPVKIGILLSLHMGLRAGEVCALKWEDIDLDERILHVRHTIARISDPLNENASTLILDSPKTVSSYRDIPIPSKILPLLRDAKQPKLSTFVVSNKETFMRPRTYEVQYHKILSNCGVEQISYHSLRHTFASRCIEAGVDMKSLSEILGHSNVSVTMNVYVHSSLEQKRNQLEKLSFL